MSKFIAHRLFAVLLASALFLLPGHALAQNKPAHTVRGNTYHFDITGTNHGERLYGDITKREDGFVINGMLDVPAPESYPVTRLQLFLHLYKDKKKVQTLYIPLTGSNGHYVIENFEFEAKSPFNHMIWGTQYNGRLD